MSAYRRPSAPTKPPQRGVRARLADPPEDPERARERVRREQAKALAALQHDHERERAASARTKGMIEVIGEVLRLIFSFLR